MRRVWTQGAHHGLIWPQGLALVDGSVPLHLVSDLWEGFAGDLPALPDFLERLSTETRSSPLSLPPFAVALLGEDSLHVACRGSFTIQWRVGTADPVTLTGADVSTWSERSVAPRDITTISLAAEEDDSQGSRPTLGGLLPASRITWILDEAAAGTTTHGAEPEAEVEAEPEAEVEAEPEAEVEAEQEVQPEPEPAPEVAQEPKSEPEPEPEPEPQPQPQPQPQPESEPQPEVVEAADEAADEGQSDDHVVVASVAQGQATLHDVDVDVDVDVESLEEHDEPAPSEPAGADESSEQTPPPGRFASLFADHTVLHAVEEAAVRPDTDPHKPSAAANSSSPVIPDDDAEDSLSSQLSVPAAAPVSPSIPAVAVPPTPQATPPAAVGGGGAFISAVPTSGRAPAPAPPSPPAPRPELAAQPTPGHDEDLVHLDGMTVILQPEPEQAPSAAAVSGAASGPAVLGVVCPAGHANPPQRTSCRSCGVPVRGDATRMPRPSLGWMHTSAGESLALETNILAGRSPRAAKFQGTGMPRLLALPHSHVSATHLEIRLEGWSVLAVDLNSTNGTFLQRPGQPTVRLGESPHLLASDDVLNLGHGVTLRFEELP